MLNREICIRCKNHRREKERDENHPFPRGWFDDDDYYWDEKKIVFCRVNIGECNSIRERPPDWCPYVLEHIVSTNDQ